VGGRARRGACTDMSTTRNTSWTGRYRSFGGALKKRVLTRANHECQLRYPGCRGIATLVDHILAQAFGGPHDETNAQAVCIACHDVKTKEEIARGKARKPQRARPSSRHPGLL